jgi:transposase, IS5 family
LITLIEPHYPKSEGGRPAYPLMAMLRIHLMQNWFGYSDPAMEEARLCRINGYRPAKVARPVF